MQFGKNVRITHISPLLLGLMAPLALLPLSAAAIEIEQRPLSSSAPAAPAAPAIPRATVPAAPAMTAAQPAPRPAAVNPAWDMFQQIEGLQATVATLQGQVEEQQQLIERMREDLRVRYTDLDQRIEQLGAKPPAASAPATAPEASAAAPVVADPAPAIAVPTPIVETPAAAPASTVVPARGEASAADIEQQKQAYLAAYQRFRSDGAPAAITAMQGFVKQYPDSVFAPNAHYWLGEFQLALEPANYQAAESSFNRVIREYQGSPKVPSAYYKMGSIADLRGQRNEARRWMTDLIAKFANSPEARLAQTYLDQNPATVAPAGSKR